MISLPAVRIIEGPDGRLGLAAGERYAEEFQRELRKHKKKGFCRVDISPPDTPKREAQQKAFYALEGCYWASGLASDQTREEFHTRLKVMYGAGAISTYIAGEHYAIVKSIRKYTLREMSRLIEGIISEGELAGVRGVNRWGDKWEEIIVGMQKEK
jgi:hypothetical protein